MKILLVSDLYPPLSLGGYEVAAAEVADGLRGSGHDVRVLTSDWRVDASTPHDPHVARTLHSRLDLRGPLWRVRLGKWEFDDGRTVRAALAGTRPDAVFIWNVGGVSHLVLEHLLNGPTPSLVYVFGDWPLRKFGAPHDLDPWTSLFARRPEGAVRSALRRAVAWGCTPLGTDATPLRFANLAFGSQFLQTQFHRGGLKASGTERVVYYGLFGAFAALAATERPPRSARPLRLLYVGRIWEGKGVHTLLEALPRLQDVETTLTIAGPEEDALYAQRLRQLADGVEVSHRVRWLGAVPRDRLPDVYADHDVVVFPSVYDEPFGIVQLEAMAAGCAVVGTGTGGSAEILERESNCLCYEAEDSEALAAQLDRIAGDPALWSRLVKAGKECIRQRFLGDRMITEMDALLEEILPGAGR